LLKYQLASMQPITYKASDGLTIHGYLTLPVGVPPKNLPMVVFPHGGPWARDSWGYNPYAQWLANRGYAVLQPNFRGSTGYGKSFLNAGNRQWAGTMHQDLIDAKNWAVAQGYADPSKVAIMGGSYGGYAVLAGVAFSPNAYAAGVDIVGPSNLNTLLQSIPPYWSTVRATFALRMGDSVAFLNSQSPLFKADQIKVPLLIGQGANDPRVNRRESDQIVAAMRKNNEPVEYIVFPDEGHGFARPENNRRFDAAVEAFLGKYLGGRVEPAAPDESVTAFEH
jgi:dipeptidyl aminopeptidase/acylaminoacyl peptidase